MKKTILIIVILVIAVGATVGIYQWRESRSENKEIISSFNFSSYRVYFNSKYGFSLEYPKDWYVVDKPEFNTVFFSSKEEKLPMGGVPLGARIELNIIQNPEGLEPKECIEKNYLQNLKQEIIKEEKITIGGRKAIKVTVAPRTGPVKEGPPVIVCLAMNDYIIQINYTGRDTGLKSGYFGNLKNLEHFLSSFKFD